MTQKSWKADSHPEQAPAAMIGVMSRRGVVLGCLLGGAVWAFAGAARAADVSADVAVVALFKDRAVLMINGQRRFLKVGETSPEGVRLVAATAEAATYSIGDAQHTAPLGDHIAQSYAPSTRVERVTVTRDRNGMYRVPGQINGRSIDMMVDTGATFVSMNRKVAARLGLPYRVKGRPVRLSTANGEAHGYRMTLRSVRVGSIEVSDVDAVISDTDFPAITLLGMSFLGKLDIEHRQEGRLTLTQRP